MACPSIEVAKFEHDRKVGEGYGLTCTHICMSARSDEMLLALGFPARWQKGLFVTASLSDKVSAGSSGIMGWKVWC